MKKILYSLLGLVSLYLLFVAGSALYFKFIKDKTPTLQEQQAQQLTDLIKAELRKPKLPATACKASETQIHNCSDNNNVGSLCQNENQIVYGRLVLSNGQTHSIPVVPTNENEITHLSSESFLQEGYNFDNIQINYGFHVSNLNDNKTHYTPQLNIKHQSSNTELSCSSTTTDIAPKQLSEMVIKTPTESLCLNEISLSECSENENQISICIDQKNNIFTRVKSMQKDFYFKLSPTEQNPIHSYHEYISQGGITDHRIFAAGAELNENIYYQRDDYSYTLTAEDYASNTTLTCSTNNIDQANLASILAGAPINNSELPLEILTPPLPYTMRGIATAITDSPTACLTGEETYNSCSQDNRLGSICKRSNGEYLARLNADNNTHSFHIIPTNENPIKISYDGEEEQTYSNEEGLISTWSIMEIINNETSGTEEAVLFQTWKIEHKSSKNSVECEAPVTGNLVLLSDIIPQAPTSEKQL
ncbi:MAG: hypothetical protein OEY19_11355 [Gammaproteobacteria bacterium]|nr:hypothetical protein [Gammaproteobacteria bacterium]